MTDKKKNQAAPAEGVELTPGVPVEIVGINFREAGKIYYFSPSGKSLSVGERVIVDTARGVEIGTVKIANKTVDPSDIIPPLKKIIRVATEDDLERDARNRELELDAALICKKKIAAHGLEMSLVEVEYTFDNSKLIFYFTCESRVDFRELVKDLASTFHTRIELRQIGIRDEAKMMGGLAVCGRKYCCSGFLSDFVQVSIKMAKEQNFSLNSAKVSGACLCYNTSCADHAAVSDGNTRSDYDTAADPHVVSNSHIHSIFVAAVSAVRVDWVSRRVD